MDRSVAGVVLAAGAASRFGGPKLAAPLGGRPILEHVLRAAQAAGLGPIVVVIGPDATELGAIARAAGAGVAINPRPADGLASSVRIGLGAIAADGSATAAAILLGDQPTVRPDVIEAVVAALEEGDGARPIAAPRYADDGAPNPVVLARHGFDLAAGLTGDRGLGPLLRDRPELVSWLDVGGSIPDVDTPGDLAGLVEAAWAARVRENAAQVDRHREVADGADFYAPVRSMFRADPHRADDPVAAALVGLAVPGETWIDIGAGGGRYALPLARSLGAVVAVDASPSMLDTLREQAAASGIGNVRAIEGRWPPDAGGALATALGPFPVADVALIAHVGYDVDAIGSFLDELERAARRQAVAVMMERQPASLADPFWPPVHGEERVHLPALADFLELLAARGAAAEVRRVERAGRAFRDREELLGFLRRQTWTSPGSAKDGRLAAELDARMVALPGRGVGLPDDRGAIGVVTWVPESGESSGG
jgi:molybdenum cofactor cytidylyltransferase